MKKSIVTLFVAIGMLMATGLAAPAEGTCGKSKCPKTEACAKCCKDPAACAKCCKDAEGCAKCSKDATGCSKDAKACKKQGKK